MKKLTKDEKFTAYCIMLAEYELGKTYFLCKIISDCFGLRGTDETMKKYFPELYLKRPKGLLSGSSWFLSWEQKKRIDILKQCIEETSG